MASSDEKPRVQAPSEPGTPETASFEAIYARYGERVLNLAYRMTGNEESARDLAQEVWIKVFQRIESFEARSDVFTWIYRITVNHTINHLRRERRVRWMSLLDRSVGEVLHDEDIDPVFKHHAQAPGADRVVEADQRSRAVWQAIQTLDPKYRVPLVLFHYEELSYQQIAEALDLSLAAVEARIHRARKQLIRELGPLLEQL